MKTKILSVCSIFLFLCAIFVGCGMGSATPAVAAEKVFEIKIAHSTTEADPIHKGWEYLKKILAERSDGRLKVVIYPNKMLCSGDNEQAEMVKSGAIQMSSAPSYTLVAMNSTLNKLYIYDFPYLFENDQEIYTFGDGKIGQAIMEDMRQKIGVRGYGPYPLGWVKVATTKKPIDKPEDLKGQKVRTTVSEMYMELMNAWGGSPTPMNYGEVYTGLQQGAIEGMMTTTSLYVSDRFYELLKYMGCVDPFAIVHYPIVNEEWYQTLPEDLKAVFDKCVWEYLGEVRKYEEAFEQEAKGLLRKHGMVVTEYTPEQKKLFVDAGKALWKTKADIVGKEFFEEIKTSMGK